MLLWPFAVLTTFGFGAFLLGTILDYAGVANIGAVIVIAVGGGVALTGLQTQSGQTVEREYGTVNNSTVVTNTTTNPTYETVALVEQFGGVGGHLSIGGLQMIIGGLLFSHKLREL